MGYETSTIRLFAGNHPLSNQTGSGTQRRCGIPPGRDGPLFPKIGKELHPVSSHRGRTPAGRFRCASHQKTVSKL